MPENNNNTRKIWRPEYIIHHPDNFKNSDGSELVYKMTQYFHCKSCKERFGVNAELHGLSQTRFDTYVKKETQNLMQSGGINFRPPYDASQELAQTTKGLCPECLATAADKFLSENKTA